MRRSTCLQAGGGQRFVEIAKVVEEIIPEVVGRISSSRVGAIPAVLLGWVSGQCAWVYHVRAYSQPDCPPE